MIAYDLHLRTLSKYVRVNRIPRGLRVNLCPTLFASDKEFCTKWEAIINKCSADLMLATMECLLKELPEIQKRIDVEETKIRNVFTPDVVVAEGNVFAPDVVVAEGNAKLADHIGKFRETTEARKWTKFQRDVADYSTGRVYRWLGNTQDSRSKSQCTSQRTSWKPRGRQEEMTAHQQSDSASSNSSFLSGSQHTEGLSKSEDGQGESTAKKKGHGSCQRPKRWYTPPAYPSRHYRNRY
ncbi:hypothetical protein XELAEV_18031428mg [Xenopus laevis]|uniref:Uncharacterized protein n=1 Tax=Xenopus laevis TaxID=8355 RepID=A0A974CPX6_XENLA|nr:hypothetical protein XELAEV_18031428mg [Xenopus laevis]